MNEDMLAGAPSWVENSLLFGATFAFARKVGIPIMVGVHQGTAGPSVAIRLDGVSEKRFPTLNDATMAMIDLTAWMQGWATCTAAGHQGPEA
jgi:hypothetical protein